MQSENSGEGVGRKMGNDAVGCEARPLIPAFFPLGRGEGDGVRTVAELMPTVRLVAAAGLRLGRDPSLHVPPIYF